MKTQCNIVLNPTFGNPSRVFQKPFGVKLIRKQQVSVIYGKLADRKLQKIICLIIPKTSRLRRVLIGSFQKISENRRKLFRTVGNQEVTLFLFKHFLYTRKSVCNSYNFFLFILPRPHSYSILYTRCAFLLLTNR